MAETKRSWTIELLVRLQNLNTKLSRKLLLQNYDAAFFKYIYTGWAKKTGLFFESLELPYKLT